MEKVILIKIEASKQAKQANLILINSGFTQITSEIYISTGSKNYKNEFYFIQDLNNIKNKLQSKQVKFNTEVRFI